VISTAPTYGLNDVTTDSNGCLYFWLPASAETTATAATVLANNQAYKNSSITVADDNTTTAILTLDANIQTHSVTYNANEAGGTAPIDSKKYLPNSPVTLPDKGDLEKTGYAFCGWTRLGNNDNAILQPGDQFFMPSEDVTLTAVWKLKTVSVDKSATAASEGLADQISFSLTTENITDGTYPVTVNSATNGVTADNVTISDNHGTLMLRTTADTPNGEHQLSVTIDGITSNDFNLNVLAKVTASYLDQDGNTQTKDGVIQLTSPGNKTLSKDEWYLLCGEVSGDFLLTVSNQAHLILKDNSCWTINKGIRVNAPNALSIYAQSTGEAMGKLIATPENKYNYDSSAAIGGNAQNTGGKITIYGGNITATGSQHGAAIGGGIYGAGGTITIYGGNITAITFQDNYMTGAAIGGGNLGNGGTITIHGGNITATSYSFGAAIGGGQDGDGGTITIYGGNIQALSNASYYATGIGGGRNASGGTITIYGGNITAIGGYEAAAIGGGGEDQSDIKSINVGTISIHGGIIKATGGKNKGTAARFAAVIGGGYGCDDGSILITGGTITATKGGNSQGYDIGHGCNTTNTKGPTQITITGGSIHCTSDNKIDGTLTNGSDQPVYLSTLTVGVAPIVANTAVTESNIGYGLTDVVTDADGKLYFWLPVTGDNGAAAERISLTANDAAYANTFVRGAVNTTSATLLPPQSPPQAEIDYVAERLTQLDNNATYLFNNTTDAADNGYPIAPEWIGETLTIVKKGDNTSTSDSEPQSLPIPARPAAPTAINGIAETIDDYNNGRIEGVNETMEYQKAGDNDSWTPCTSTNGGSIENLAPDTYHIRYKATSEAFASEPATIVIANGAAQTRVLNITLPTFDPLTYGYGELPEAQAITIKNSGNTPATITKIAVSNPELFTLGGSDAMVEVVEADAEIATWTIQPALNLNAGTYSASITVTYNGTSGETATETQSFTVEKKAPEVEDLDFTLKNATYNGVAHGVTVSWKSPRTNPGGALTVKYNGSTIQPIDPGAYAVTVEVNAAGTNFLATNKPLALGTFRIFSPTEPLLCSVTIPVIPGAKTTPIAGIYHLSAGYDFEFLIHPNAEVDASAMTVTTGRPNDDRGGVVVTPRTDGSYYVRIVAVNERITVSVQLPIPTDLASPKGENLRIWTSASQLHLSAGAEAVHAKVFTPAGLLVKTLKAAPGETVATTLAPGLYFVATNKGDPHKIVISGF
jgi:uncharacterized repeat protein (TIGR02543 family)